MNTSDHADTIQVQFSGHLTISRNEFSKLLPKMVIQNAESRVPAEPPLKPTSVSNERLAYSMKESAEILGISYISVHRLLKRGLLKRSGALRNVVISRKELERFLERTSADDWR